MEDEANRSKHTVRQIVLLLAYLLIVSYLLPRLNDLPRVLAVCAVSVPVWILYRQSGLRRADIGLSKDSVSSGLRWGMAALLLVAVIIAAGIFITPGSFMDDRYHQSLQSAIIRSIIFIPLATVIFEELVFRGLLLALLRRQYSLKIAAVISSLCFGLWHVFSSLGVSNALFNASDAPHAVLSMLTVIIVTSLAGLVFCYLRLLSGSIIASMLAHWSINAFALIAAAIAFATHTQ